ncbi:MAG: hypothetical protein C0598_01325 [Marinilabiliales bacterium]|nr:MAG: hypothetical protein C0598_01325 [Marinilabiliales bacterium]
MKVLLNDAEIDKTLLTLNDGLNYGRFDIDNILIDNYKIIISIKEFIQLIEKEYFEIRDQIQLDDEQYNDTSEFSSINYPSLDELIIKFPQHLQEIFTTYFDKIFFAKLFTNSNNPDFVINSTDKISIINGYFEISGRTYSKQSI